MKNIIIIQVAKLLKNLVGRQQKLVKIWLIKKIGVKVVEQVSHQKQMSFLD